MECLKTHSTVLAEIGLALLKFVSSHRGLTFVQPSSSPLLADIAKTRDLRRVYTKTVCCQGA